MKITLTRPKEVRRQKRGKKFQVIYRAVAKVPFEASVNVAMQDISSPTFQELTNFAMNETFELVKERLAKYMGGFDRFSEKLYKKGRTLKEAK